MQGWRDERSAQPTPSPCQVNSAGQALGLHLRSINTNTSTFHQSSPTFLDAQTVDPTTTSDTTMMTGFRIDCTLPPHGTAFVQPPNARGTLDIVYSCMAVVVLCTWSVLHLNVPVQITPANGLQKLVRSLGRTSNKVAWMAFNILAPEWPFAQAVCGLLIQRQLQDRFDRYKECDRVPWTGSHTQLANMGGFVLSFDQTLHSSIDLDRDVDQSENTRCVNDKWCYNRRWPEYWPRRYATLS
jgi:hypothetical protein